jgi:hypothetical protein
MRADFVVASRPLPTLPGSAPAAGRRLPDYRSRQARGGFVEVALLIRCNVNQLEACVVG